jgi:hypothetical protein
MVFEFPHYMEVENKLQLLNIFGPKDIDLLFCSVNSLFQTFFFLRAAVRQKHQV